MPTYGLRDISRHTKAQFSMAWYGRHALFCLMHEFVVLFTALIHPPLSFKTSDDLLAISFQDRVPRCKTILQLYGYVRLAPPLKYGANICAFLLLVNALDLLAIARPQQAKERP
jgi:hypothetical protein